MWDYNSGEQLQRTSLYTEQRHELLLTEPNYFILKKPVADPGFLVGGRGLPRRLRFVKFVCRNERIGSLRGAHPVRPLDPPMEIFDYWKIALLCSR